MNTLVQRRRLIPTIIVAASMLVLCQPSSLTYPVFTTMQNSSCLPSPCQNGGRCAIGNDGFAECDLRSSYSIYRMHEYRAGECLNICWHSGAVLLGSGGGEDDVSPTFCPVQREELVLADSKCGASQTSAAVILLHYLNNGYASVRSSFM
ncbi:putative protein jagged-1b [Trichinella spiralis]|uniref:putative protein jagged-1b n=1 Tax=Trichinella spiralis TaxID=6334 RepID=UPI0001EFBA17|nr:putative protein jagged-1b [Trichinella spiralis]